ncbi:MAG TPA: hypothetical protein VFZ58_04750 [Candidatus Saccharimonadales bacterium]
MCIFEQAQALLDEFSAVGKVVLDLGQPFTEPFALTFNLPELALDLHLGAFGQVADAQVDQVALFDVQSVQLGGELLTQETGS